VKPKQPAGPTAHAHKFILGQTVGYSPPRGVQAPPGIYVVIAKLSERDGDFEYYIKHTRELSERIAKESELHQLADDARQHARGRSHQ
jgi:hypothetical protein